MSRYFLSFAALALISTGGVSVQQSSDPGSAQGTPQQEAGRRGGYGRGTSQRQHMAMLARKLNLNDAQRQQFFEISQHTREQAMAIRNDGSLSADQKKEKLQTLRKQSHQEMFAVLTPEQKEQLKQMREQMEKERESKKAPGDQASNKKDADDDPFAGMTSEDDDDGPVAKAR